MTTSPVYYHPTRAHARPLQVGDRVRDDSPGARFNPHAANYPGANRYGTISRAARAGDAVTVRWDDGVDTGGIIDPASSYVTLTRL